MDWVCSACHGTNPPGTRFCGHCGAPASSPAPVAARRAEEEREERRLVTVLFADISGFTALADRVDPERLVEIIDPVLQTMNDVVARYGGHVSKFAGDALLAFFGAPAAHDDDAARAVLAARDMLREVAAVVAALPPEGRHMTLHIGVNTGHVVTGGAVDKLRLDHSVVGDTVNVAQRLEAASPSGEVYVGELTYLLAREAVPFGPVGELVVKGKPEPVLAWRLLPDEPARRSAAAGALVGRGRELATLDGVLEAVSSGRARVLALLGEPGVGKSRLLAEMRERAAGAGMRWLESRCLSYGGGLPYWPYAELLRGVAGVQPDDAPAAAAALVTHLADRHGLRSSPYLAHLMGLDGGGIPAVVRGNPEVMRTRIRDAMVELLAALARETPTVLVLEDVHWADTASLEMTRVLVTRCADVPVGFALTLRPEGRPLVEEIARGSAQEPELLELERLDRASVHTLVCDVLGAADEELLDLVAARTSGNPLFVHEVVKSLLDGNSLVRASTGWRLLEAPGAGQVPTTIESVLSARIDLLPRDAASVLQTAAAVGRQVPLPLLQALLPDVDRLDALLDSLVEHEFLHRDGDAAAPVLVFHHALLLDVAYGRLLRRHRRELHRQLLEVAGRLYGTGDDVIDLLAHHAARADIGAAALAYLTRAARRAAALFANDQAIGLLDTAVEIARADEAAAAELPGLLLELASLCELSGRLERAIELYDEATVLAGEPRAYLGKAASLTTLARLDESLEVLDAASRATTQPTADDLTLFAVERARVLGITGKVRLGVDVLNEALAGVAGSGSRVEARALMAMAGLEERLGAHELAAEHAERAAALLEELGDLPRLASALRTLGGVLEDVEAMRDRVVPVLERALAIARQVGNPEEEGAALTNLGRAEYLRELHEEAARHQREALAAFDSVGIKGGVACAYVNLADALTALGHLDEAEGAARAGLDVAVNAGYRTWQAGATVALGLISMERHDYAEAAARCDEAADMLAAFGSPQVDEVRGWAAAARERLAEQHSAASG